MKLNIEQIKAITRGAVRVTEEGEAFRFYRFTKEQEELYRITSEDFFRKTFSTAGVRLVFKTNSQTLYLRTEVFKGSSRKYFSFDVLVDGKPVGYLNNFSDVEMPKAYTGVDLPFGTHEKTFDLGEGDKTVCVYFPWSVKPFVEEISIDDGAYVEPVKAEKKLLVYGDSITHGYDALKSANRYAARLADSLGVEEINKAIGGETFFPALAELKDDFEPDYITVAYGTNDWSHTSEELFKKNCKAFYTALTKNYPNAKIFAITPIWRKDHEAWRPFGPFVNVEKDIREAVESLENVTVIPGFDFVPKDPDYFSDLSLHPNDEGFDHYFNNLQPKIFAEL